MLGIVSGITPQMWRKYLTVVGALAFYFVSSISLTMFNKWFFAEHKPAAPSPSPNATSAPPKATFFTGTYHFHFPLTVTCIHQFLVWVLILLLEKRVLVPLAGEITRSRALAWSICPIGCLCGIDWGLSNTSLRYISLSLYEIVKSASPMFVLLVSFVLGMQQPNKLLIAIVALISFGMFLAVSGGNMSTFTATDFPMTGFLCVCCAAVLAGIRVVLAQRVMQKVVESPLRILHVRKNDDDNVDDGEDDAQMMKETRPPSPPSDANGASGSNGSPSTSVAGNGVLPPVNAITTLFYVAPASACSLVLPALVVEAPEVMEYFATEPRPVILGAIFWIFVSSSVAFLLSISEFVVTRKTSALTLCVTGISKQVLIIGLAMIIFGDRMRFANVVGFAITIAGIGLYNYYKLKIQHAQPYSPLHQSSGGGASSIGNGNGGVEERASLVSVASGGGGAGVGSSNSTTSRIQR